MIETRRLLIIEDDPALAETLVRAMTRRGFTVMMSHTAEDAQEQATQFLPDCVLVDLKLPGRSGLECVAQMAAMSDPPQIVVLTGFASIATAVEAIKLGAAHYLAKPATASEIAAAFDRTQGDAMHPVGLPSAGLKVAEWEHIQSVLRDVDFNISEAARRLCMHRRTLARKLAKRQLR